MSSLYVVLGVPLFWIAVGLLGLPFKSSRATHARLFFPLGAVGGLVLAVAGYLGLAAAPLSLVLPLGLPDLPFHLRLDALSAFFLMLLGVVSASVSLYSASYFEDGSGDVRLICLQYHVFLASMAMVLLADDAYLFMVAWETMALASYFLVTTDHEVAAIRSAGFLYLIVAHVGAIAILLGFGTLQLGQWNYSFDAMRGNTLSPVWASIAFLLALFGFGAKAGFLPVHVWLPEDTGRAFSDFGSAERRCSTAIYEPCASPTCCTYRLGGGGGGPVRGPAHGAVGDVRRRADRYETASPTLRSRTSALFSALD